MAATLERVDQPILIDAMTWREFKATEQLLDRQNTTLNLIVEIIRVS